jgi:8-oxo-dGTP pyrophosphatase MutT (NUDIX family)
VVGALIVNEGRVFVHRRGPQRAFLPNCWDIAGGHVEAGETLLEALEREVHEETGWHVEGEPRLVDTSDWQTERDDRATGRREFDFLVTVEGDVVRPRLEIPKHTEYRWVGRDDLDILDENRGKDDGAIRRLVELALSLTAADAAD